MLTGVFFTGSKATSVSHDERRERFEVAFIRSQGSSHTRPIRLQGEHAYLHRERIFHRSLLNRSGGRGGSHQSTQSGNQQTHLHLLLRHAS